MRFDQPLALLLLLTVPLAAALGWPRRGRSARRERLALVLRLIILLCVIFALAGLEVVQAGRGVAVAFLLDVSDSVSLPARQGAEAYIATALQSLGPDDRAALVVFGREALVERPMSAAKELGKITSIPRTDATDLAAAIRLGLALFPPGMQRRIVILSDGAATGSDSQEAARLARSSGVDLQTVVLPAESGPETALTGADAPGRLSPGQRFDLQLTVESTRAVQAKIRVLAGGEVIYSTDQPLRLERQSFSLPLVAAGPAFERPGFTRLTVQIEPQADGLPQNNQLDAFTQVEGPPRLLIVSPPAGEPLARGGTRPDEAAQLAAALQSAGFDLTRLPPSRLPADLIELAGYASILLVDVPARDLTSAQMAVLQSFVRDTGGGLVAVGGPTSFGVGGYFRTPLETILPVEMEIKDELRRPSLALVFIIDHSGSMTDLSGGVSKLELAKEAVLRSLDLLSPSDRVGVIAFDESASWVAPMTDLSDPTAVKNAVATIRAGGGTDILAGVQAMASVLPGEPAQVKHVILLTDGGADPTGIPELVAHLNQDSGITLSAIGVGQDAAAFLPELAERGGGRYHFTPNPAAIPTIFAEETSLATRAYLVEEPFTPQFASPSPLIAGFDALPPLLGYVATSPRPAAQTVLVSPQGDPLLAAWQYGLGRAVAFTSDATARWAQSWVGWSGFPVFWAQVVEYSLKSASGSNLDIQVGAEGQVIVEAQSQGGEYLNGYDLQAVIAPPEGEPQTVTLSQTAPGRYEGRFAGGAQGAYSVQVAGGAPGTDEAALRGELGWVQPYSAEYRSLQGQPELLCRLDSEPQPCLASLRPGVMSGKEPSAAFDPTGARSFTRRPAWPWLLGLAAFLLPLDVAARRLVLTRADLQRLGQFLRGKLPRAREAPPTPVQPPSPGVEALRKARRRSEQRAQPPPASPSPLPGEIKPPSQSEKPRHSTQPSDGLSTTERLLAKKRKK